MERLGSNMLAKMEILGLDEVLARIDKVDADQLTALARELYDAAHLSVGAIGPDEELFREAIARLQPDVAVAT